MDKIYVFYFSVRDLAEPDIAPVLRDNNFGGFSFVFHRLPPLQDRSQYSNQLLTSEETLPEAYQVSRKTKDLKNVSCLDLTRLTYRNRKRSILL